MTMIVVVVTFMPSANNAVGRHTPEAARDLGENSSLSFKQVTNGQNNEVESNEVGMAQLKLTSQCFALYLPDIMKCEQLCKDAGWFMKGNMGWQVHLNSPVNDK